jgi:hypothetical protein
MNGAAGALAWEIGNVKIHRRLCGRAIDSREEVSLSQDLKDIVAKRDILARPLADS